MDSPLSIYLETIRICVERIKESAEDIEYLAQIALDSFEEIDISDVE